MARLEERLRSALELAAAGALLAPRSPPGALALLQRAAGLTTQGPAWAAAVADLMVAALRGEVPEAPVEAQRSVLAVLDFVTTEFLCS